jgi:hypothetical protein
VRSRTNVETGYSGLFLNNQFKEYFRAAAVGEGILFFLVSVRNVQNDQKCQNVRHTQAQFPDIQEIQPDGEVLCIYYSQEIEEFSV